MTAKQHKNATTTPEIRAFIRESELPTAVLARLLKISESTVRKWRKRETLEDASHIPKHINTTLTLQQQYVVVQLRTHLMLSLDQLLKVCREFINENTSRAGLQRCLKRHGVSKLADIDPADELGQLEHQVSVAIQDQTSAEVKSSVVNPQAMIEVLNQLRAEDAAEQSSSELAKHTRNAKSRSLTCEDVVQVSVTTLPNLDDKKSDKATVKNNKPHRLLIANDPDSQWVYVDLYQDDEADAARRYMKHVLRHAPYPIRRLLAANYNEFLSRFRLLSEQ
ncbi:helix-turn-helix domain-containing protein [Psychromonas algicola]|uniref:helix-turn-helix domain-containing protein n=1 Tax=Psychromonas algicola TaxID=2555642 RepID=UPI0010685267|nr:helix-turn-helix domain-containing protein [Psychromonas sp. RZ5]TEW53002.1 helix-turn-helix domain-containing protein [Psychromonas sp. RZ5]